MITVEVNVGRVELRLAAGELCCPGCGGGLTGWGWARLRRVRGLNSSVRPRRARCTPCRVTHVLLPVVLLVRRAYAAAVIGAVLTAKGARGWGFRRIAAVMGIPESTVRAWLRRMAGRADAVRGLFTALAADQGMGPPSPAGSVWADLLAALGALAAAVRGFSARSAAGGGVVEVPVWTVAVAVSGGRLLAPGWPGPAHRVVATPTGL